MASVKENLIAAKALITDERNWFKGGYRMEIPTGTVCYCAVGALMTVTGLPASLVHDSAEHFALEEEVGVNRTVVGFNDNDETTHADILALFERAIAAQDDAP